MSSHDETQAVDSISDEDALKLRDHVVELMIADACQWLPPIKNLAMAHTSPFANARAVPMHEATCQGILLRSGIRLGVLDPLGAGRVHPTALDAFELVRA